MLAAAVAVRITTTTPAGTSKRMKVLVDLVVAALVLGDRHHLVLPLLQTDLPTLVAARAAGMPVVTTQKHLAALELLFFATQVPNAVQAGRLRLLAGIHITRSHHPALTRRKYHGSLCSNRRQQHRPASAGD
jgi:hypothetical protein